MVARVSHWYSLHYTTLSYATIDTYSHARAGGISNNGEGWKSGKNRPLGWVGTDSSLGTNWFKLGYELTQTWVRTASNLGTKLLGTERPDALKKVFSLTRRTRSMWYINFDHLFILSHKNIIIVIELCDTIVSKVTLHQVVHRIRGWMAGKLRTYFSRDTECLNHNIWMISCKH